MKKRKLYYSAAMLAAVMLSLLSVSCSKRIIDDVPDPVIILDTHQCEFGEQGGIDEISFTVHERIKDMELTILPGEDWVKPLLSYDNNTGAGTLTLEVSENTQEQPRTCEIVLEYDSAQAAINILQKAASPIPEPEFKIEILETTMTGVKTAVEETTGSITYYVSVDNKEDFDSKYASDEQAYFKMKMDFIKVMAGVYSQSVSEYLDDVLKTGKSEYADEDLYFDTAYYVSVFGLDKEGNILTPLFKKEFRTESFEPSQDCKFIIQDVEITSSSIEVLVGASDPEVRYYVSYMSEDDYSLYDTPEEAASDIIFSAEIFDEIDWSDPANTMTGKNNVKFESLEPGVKYFVFAFGVSAEGELTTAVAMESFTTAAEE